MTILERYLPTTQRISEEPILAVDGSGPVTLPSARPQAQHKLVALVVGVGALRMRQGRREQVQAIDVYVPNVLTAAPELFALEPTLEQTMAGPNQPECLRCHDLRPVAFGGGPYRAAQRERDPDFHGYSFGNTIELALAGLQKTMIGVEPDSYVVAAYARPLLWLNYGLGDARNQLVFYAESDGALRAFVGRPVDES